MVGDVGARSLSCVGRGAKTGDVFLLLLTDVGVLGSGFGIRSGSVGEEGACGCATCSPWFRCVGRACGDLVFLPLAVDDGRGVDGHRVSAVVALGAVLSLMFVSGSALLFPSWEPKGSEAHAPYRLSFCGVCLSFLFSNELHFLR